MTRTPQALAYVATQRALKLAAPYKEQWQERDVAAAYDAGLRSAVENRQNARRQLKDVEVREEVA